VVRPIPRRGALRPRRNAWSRALWWFVHVHVPFTALGSRRRGSGREDEHVEDRSDHGRGHGRVRRFRIFLRRFGFAWLRQCLPGAALTPRLLTRLCGFGRDHTVAMRKTRLPKLGQRRPHATVVTLHAFGWRPLRERILRVVRRSTRGAERRHRQEQQRSATNTRRNHAFGTASGVPFEPFAEGPIFGQALENGRHGECCSPASVWPRLVTSSRRMATQRRVRCQWRRRSGGFGRSDEWLDSLRLALIMKLTFIFSQATRRPREDTR
jgi:hypothetical protein